MSIASSMDQVMGIICAFFVLLWSALRLPIHAIRFIDRLGPTGCFASATPGNYQPPPAHICSHHPQSASPIGLSFVSCSLVIDLGGGSRVLDIRATHRYIRNDPERIRLLNEAGFRWTDATKASYGNVVRALKVLLWPTRARLELWCCCCCCCCSRSFLLRP